MFFRDVIGQLPVKNQLRNMADQKRIHHALLLLGKEGSGALPLAMAFAQFINCHQPQEGDSCGVCPACIKAQQLAHPDIHFSYPTVPRKSGDKPKATDYIQEWREFVKLYPYGNVYDWLQSIDAENKQGNITVEECNDIARKLNLKSFESPYKILILWMPEYLGKEGNKLLKLLEEPPDNTLFIWVAEEEGSILPTLLSRMQLIKVPPLSSEDIAQALQERADVEAQKAWQLAPVSDGNYREALQSLQHAEEDWMGLLREWLNAILKTGPVAQVKWVDEVQKLGREKQKQLLRYFIHLLEQSIRLEAIGEKVPIPLSEKDFAARLNRLCDMGQKEALVRQLESAVYYIERNANGKMLFLALTIKIYHLIRDKALVEAW